MRAQNTQLQTLLTDAATRRGLEHAYRDPLFLTWPLSCFCRSRRAVLPPARFLQLSGIDFPGDAFAEVLHNYSTTYHTLKQYMPASDGMPDDAYSAWKNCKPAQSPAVLDFFEICDVELYVPDDQD